MSCWRVLYQDEKSFLFSGSIEDVRTASIAQLTQNPRVIWWRDENVTDFVLHSNIACPDRYVWGHFYDADNGLHALFQVTVEAEHHATLDQLIESPDFQEQVGKVVTGQSSTLPASKSELYFNKTLLLPQHVPDLHDRTMDRRQPKATDALRMNP
jgi:hypothetical protein